MGHGWIVQEDNDPENSSNFRTEIIPSLNFTESLWGGAKEDHGLWMYLEEFSINKTRQKM